MPCWAGCLSATAASATLAAFKWEQHEFNHHERQDTLLTFHTHAWSNNIVSGCGSLLFTMLACCQLPLCYTWVLPLVAAEAVAMLPHLQQQQQPEVQAVGPPTPPESTIAAAAAVTQPQGAVAAAAAVAAPPTPAAAAAMTALVPRQVVAAPVAYRAAAVAEPDVFYDANEVVPGSTLDLLMRELREAKEAQEQTHR